MMGRLTIDDVLAEAQARLRRLTPRQALAAMTEGWTLVDTRSIDALRADGAIPGAIHLPLSVLEWRVDPASRDRDPRLAGHERRLILLCDGGYSSSLGAIRLHELGLTDTTDVIGGFRAWRADGLPVDLPVEHVTAVVLAAGGSRRFGGQKLLEPLEGKPLLQHALDAANGSKLDDVVLVVGHRANEVLGAVRLGRARALVNDEHDSGHASSLRAGLRAARGSDGAVVVLGDQPRVTSALLDAVVERQRVERAAAVVSSSKGHRSPPTFLRRDLWPALDALTGDVGARDLLAGRDDVAVLEVSDALGSLEDVDRPDDLARIARSGA